MAEGDYTKVFESGNRLRRQRWYWQRRAANHEIIAVGAEPFVSRLNAERASRRAFPEQGLVPRYAPEHRPAFPFLLLLACLLLLLGGVLIGYGLWGDDDAAVVAAPVTTTTVVTTTSEVFPSTTDAFPSSPDTNVSTTTTTVPAPPPAPVVPNPPAAPAPPLPPQVVTVAKDDNLWDIAEAVYGDGRRWVDIYAANQGQIVDPNVIFTGQVLALG